MPNLSDPAAGFGVVIPARYASERLPGKPLRDIAGKPMIVRAWENAQSSGAEFVLVATDDERIAEAVRGAGGEAVMTSSAHRSGTDRIAEAAAERRLPDDVIVVNAQGDEPFLPPGLVAQVASNLAQRPSAGVATLAAPFGAGDNPSNPNAVKVVCAKNGMALYFSRAWIPYQRGAKGPTPLRHVGIYAYRVGTLKRLAQADPAPVEIAESLEQLRALWMGIAIHVDMVATPPAHGVDTEEDLQRANELFDRNT